MCDHPATFFNRPYRFSYKSDIIVDYLFKKKHKNLGNGSRVGKKKGHPMEIRAHLRPEEKASLELRTLYEEHGYHKFKVNKFEEYSLYADNKEFLAGDKVLTFTNLDGRLMALKPDVTMSIIKNTDVEPGEIKRLYYNENVYRENKSSTTFMEIPQIGLECIGALGLAEIGEVTVLAAKTLELIDTHFVLTLSHMTFAEELIKSMQLEKGLYVQLLELIRAKNADGIRKAAGKEGVAPEDIEALCVLPGLYGAPAQVLLRAKEFLRNAAMEQALEELQQVVAMLEAAGYQEGIQLDLSMVNDIDYYNGVIFSGYVRGLQGRILGGGQYDRAMKHFGKHGGGMGLGLYLNEIERIEEADSEEDAAMLTIALPKGRLGDQVYNMLEKAGYECPAYNDKDRKLVIENRERQVRYILVKPTDVPVYVERRAADIGIVGKDILLENNPDVYELMDLGIGKCRMCVAAKKGFQDDESRRLHVATKFVNVAKAHYRERNRDIDIIKLNGSIELGPILGLSDVIVDIVETGSTIHANNLEIVEEFQQISARLICNKVSFKFKNDHVCRIVDALRSEEE